MASENITVFFSRIAHQISRGVKREFPAPHRCVIFMPGGFPYEAFDGKAEMKPWHVLNMVESSRGLAFISKEKDHTSYLDFNKAYSQSFAFIGSTKLDIKPEMYDLIVSKTPLRIEKELVSHGTSSMNIRTTILNSETNHLLAECQQQTVSVAKDTRRSTPLPDWWKNKYSKFNNAGSALRIQPPVRPSQSEITSYPMVVQASDTDSYLHVNWTSFLKYCLDAVAGMTWQRNKSATLAELYRPVKSAEIAYVRECNLGDQLTVDVWSDKTTSDQLNFEILNPDKKVAMHASVEYFHISN